VEAEDFAAQPVQQIQPGNGPLPEGQHPPNGHQPSEGEHRRKRRRRRGRRGGRDRQPGDPQQGSFANESDRFGSAPDEIDTTPGNTSQAPGVPSAPVWSLKDDMPDTTPKDEGPKPIKKGWWQRTFSGE
jgi:hypothetical protein